MTDQSIKRVAVIMAGGSGERFWPLSRRHQPKQLLCLADPDRTMLEETILRLLPMFPVEDIFIATSELLREPIQMADTGIPSENVLAEPAKRNTAGCLAYATAHILARYAQDRSVNDPVLHDTLSIAVVTADQAIGAPEAFRQTISAAFEVAEREHALATIGIEPTRPDTGFGYIEIGSETEPPGSVPVHHVAAFHEKPSLETAHTFLASGRHLWNAGMFFWRVGDFLTELHEAQPRFAQAIFDMASAFQTNRPDAVRAIFEALPGISIDYALMEHAKRVVVARAMFPWDDLGTWAALDRGFLRDDHGNVSVGDVVALDTENCVLYNHAQGGSDRILAVLGVEDLVVVSTDDAVLVAPKKRSEEIKRIVEALTKRGAKQI